MATQTKLITYDDYRTLPNDGNQYEVIGGELIMAPSPKTIHQRILRKLLARLNDYVEKSNAGEVFCAPMDVVLSMKDIVQPDLFYVSNERSDIISENNIIEAPDLVIEIISESTKTLDQTRKKTLYEKYGVKEYWLVYPDNEKVEKFILQGETLVLEDELIQAETLNSKTIERFSLQLSEIFTS